MTEVAEIPVEIRMPQTTDEFQIADATAACVLKRPANRLQRFLQLLVGIEWRNRT